MDSSGRQSFFDEPHQILVRAQTLNAEDLLDPLKDTRMFESWGVDRGRLCHRASSCGTLPMILWHLAKKQSKFPQSIGYPGPYIHGEHITVASEELRASEAEESAGS